MFCELYIMICHLLLIKDIGVKGYDCSILFDELK